MKKIKTKLVNGFINIQLLVSIDNGQTFHYCGVGRFCSNLLEAKNYVKEILT